MIKKTEKYARISLNDLLEIKNKRPRGYLKEVLRAPSRVDFQQGVVFLPLQRYSALKRQFEERPPLSKQIKSLIRELARWKENGFKIASLKTFLARSAICKACPFSYSTFGISRCGRCGCTRAKLLLASARCPERKW